MNTEIPDALLERLERLRPILQHNGSVHQRKDRDKPVFILRYLEPLPDQIAANRSITLGDTSVAKAVTDLLLKWRNDKPQIDNDAQRRAEIDAILADLDAEMERQITTTLDRLKKPALKAKYSVRGALY